MNNVESHPIGMDIIPKAPVQLCDQDSDSLKQSFLHVLTLHPSEGGQPLTVPGPSRARGTSHCLFSF